MSAARQGYEAGQPGRQGTDAGLDASENPGGAGAGQTVDALVIGGGLSGSAAAICIARSGRSVLLVEKSTGAHPKMCGEFLSHEALHYLRLLGVEPRALGAVPIERVRFVRDRVLAAADLPFASLSLSRQRLDEVLLERAAQSGARVVRGQRVRSLARTFGTAGACGGADGRALWRAELDEVSSRSRELGRGPSGRVSGKLAGGLDPGQPQNSPSDTGLLARQAFLATGKQDLHGWNRPAGPQNDLVAFKMYFRLTAEEQSALAGHVELILFPSGYAGLQPVEDGMANLCLLVEKSAFRRLGATWPALLDHILRHSAHLAGRLSEAEPLWPRPLSLSSIPYGYVRRSAGEPGLWRLGDQSAVIPSFAGDGMSIALHSAHLAAATYLRGESSQRYQEKLAAEIVRPVRLATSISRAFLAFPGMVDAAARLCPGLLGVIAGSTRIPSARLLE